MKDIIGIGIIIVDILVFGTIFAVIMKKKIYKGDFSGMLIDCLEGIELFFIILLIGIIILKSS